MLRVAVPNKGALSESASAILAEAGYRKRSDAKDLTVLDNTNDVEFFYLRPRDVALYVGKGQVDAGITGRDLLLDSGSTATEVMGLGFGGSTFRFAGRPGEASSAASSSSTTARRRAASGGDRGGRAGGVQYGNRALESGSRTDAR